MDFDAELAWTSHFYSTPLSSVPADVLMGEVVNVLVAFAVIVFIFRWVTSRSESTEQRSAADTLGFRPKNVTQEMTDTVSNMFPDIPADNIRYDLLRTGNVGRTTEKILERGFLDAPPPAYYRLYPRAPPTTAAGAPAAALVNKPAESLISRYQLQERARKAEPISEKEVGGKATWEDTAEKREASLRERKAQMVLAARQRLLGQQQQAETKKEVTKS